MIVEIGDIIVRTKNRYAGQRAIERNVYDIGSLFKAVCSSSKGAFYSDSYYISEADFRMANDKEINAYIMGCRNIKDVDKYNMYEIY